MSIPFSPDSDTPPQQSNKISTNFHSMADSTEDVKPIFDRTIATARHVHSQPQQLQSLNASMNMPSQHSIYAGTQETPRQTAFQQTSMGHGETSSGMSSLHHGFLDSNVSDTSFSTAPMPSSLQWPSYSSHVPFSGFDRSPYANMSSTFSPTAVTGLTSSQFTSESPSTSNASPVRTQNYYDFSSGHMTRSDAPAYTYHEGASSSESSINNPYAMVASSEFVGNDIDSMLEHVSALYKNANTKKMAELYRDKWARMWLTCNYTLKPSIQISIPRTVLHESYRQACEAFALEPLQAASFGKVLRSQFPDVAQRRLGGRGKTRFHYCGFGTATEREAQKIKTLLEEEKAGRLHLSAGMSSEHPTLTKAKAKSEGHVPSGASGSRTAFPGAPYENRAQRALSFATSSSYATGSSSSSGSQHAQIRDDRLASSAFATLTGGMTPSSSSGHHVSTPHQLHQLQLQQQQQQMQASMGGQGGVIPRRHTVSHSQSYPNLPGTTYLPDMGFQSYPTPSPAMGMSMTAEQNYSSEGAGGDQSSLTSQLNSPASSMVGYNHGHSSQSPHYLRTQRYCSDLADWPNVDESGQIRSLSSTGGNSTLSPNARSAWREYEALCQDLLHCIYQGPDLNSFEQRTISFWSNVSSSTHDALQSEPLLSQIMLQADGIVFRQLLTRLDEMIGDDVQAEHMSGIQHLSNTLSNKIHGLMKGVMSGASIEAKIRSSQNVAQSLERIAKIFEAVRAFRDNAMLDVTSYWQDGSALTIMEDPHGAASTFSIPAQAGLPPGFQNNLQYRQREISLHSTLSDTHPSWMQGEEGAPSSASESDHAALHGGMRMFTAQTPSKLEPSRPRSATDSSGYVGSSLASIALSAPPQDLHSDSSSTSNHGHIATHLS